MAGYGLGHVGSGDIWYGMRLCSSGRYGLWYAAGLRGLLCPGLSVGFLGKMSCWNLANVLPSSLIFSALGINVTDS